MTDNGPGMPENVRDRIFEPYFTTKSSGSGIGLSVTKRAMDLHQGIIQVESSTGQGTKMVFTSVSCRYRVCRESRVVIQRPFNAFRRYFDVGRLLPAKEAYRAYPCPRSLGGNAGGNSRHNNEAADSGSG